MGKGRGLFVLAAVVVSTLVAPGPAGGQTTVPPPTTAPAFRDGPQGAQPPSAPLADAATRLPETRAEAAPVPSAGPGVYGPVEWLPLRADARVGCVFSNCNFDTGPYHGYWAIDFIDPANAAGDPIHAAGAGQARIIQRGTTCGGPGTLANAVEVDHGGGVVTWYFHLATITITEGQWVDPTTQLGTMGATGYTFPCPANHLHFEKQVNGTRVDPGPLKACHAATLVQYPQALGFAGWNDVPPQTHIIHSNGAACAPASRRTAGDYDGDGDTDIAVFRPSNGVWYLQGAATAWGANGDVPVPGDYDGDTDTDMAVFRPSNGVWYVRAGVTVGWGTNGDVPVPGDYDGDGDTDIAVFRPSTGVWFIRGGATVGWGTNGDVPVPGDYDADGDTDIAVFRPSTGVWYLQGAAAGTAWGATGDVPVPGDYDGDGDTDMAVFRPSTGVWYVRGGVTAGWGANGDVPVPGDYDGDGDTDLAVFRPSNGVWYVRGGATVGWGTSTDVALPLPFAIRRSMT